MPTPKAPERPKISPPRKSGALQSRALIVGALLVMICVSGVVGWSLWDSRQGAFSQAVQNSQNLTAALAHDIERNLESYDLSLQGVINGLQFEEIKSVSPALRDQILFDRSATAKFLGSVLVLGEDGETLVDSRSPVPRTTNYADRDYFRIHRDTADAGLFISTPFRSRLDNEWEIALSRRLNHPDGSFAGAVVGTLKLAFFQNLFNDVDAGPDGAIALLSTTRIMIIRKPYDQADWGRDFSNSELFSHFQASPVGAFGYRALVDGVERVSAYQQVGNFPIILSFAVSRDAIFAEWRKKAEVVGAAVLFTIFLSAALTAFAVAELGRRGRAERAALESETRYRLLADNSSDMIVLADLDGVRQFVSPAARTLYGVEPDEMMQSDMFGSAHPDDQPKLIAAVEQLKAGADLAVVELRARRKGGDYIWVETHMRLVEDPLSGEMRVLGQVRDVSRRHAVEQAVRESEAQFRSLADSVSDVIIRSEPDGRRSYVSPSCRTVLGFEPEQLTGVARGSFTHALDRPQIEARMAEIIAGDPNTVIVFRAVRNDGAVIWLESHLAGLRSCDRRHRRDYLDHARYFSA